MSLLQASLVWHLLLYAAVNAGNGMACLLRFMLALPVSVCCNVPCVLLCQCYVQVTRFMAAASSSFEQLPLSTITQGVMLEVRRGGGGHPALGRVCVSPKGGGPPPGGGVGCHTQGVLLEVSRGRTTGTPSSWRSAGAADMHAALLLVACAVRVQEREPRLVYILCAGAVPVQITCRTDCCSPGRGNS
jgi:hypothetical protein